LPTRSSATTVIEGLPTVADTALQLILHISAVLQVKPHRQYG
jgi:hypothetical protein